MSELSEVSATRRRLRIFDWMAASPSPGQVGALLGWRERAILLVVVAILVLCRLPGVVYHGRFLGEEGTFFFAYAWHRDAWDALWRSFGGYLNLGANASTLLAARAVQHGILPLERAPHLTMSIAFAFQLLPAILILWGRGSWLNNRWAYIASLLMIVLAPYSEEVWLNVLHIQYHLALCCALILALEPPTSRKGWTAQGALLLLAPLCGPGALILGPVFLARFFIDRSPARFAQTVMLGIGGLVQLLIFFTPSPVRGQLIDLPSLASIIFVRLGAVPVAGLMNGLNVGEFAFHAHQRQDLAWWMFSGLSMVYCAALGYAAWHYRRQPAGWLIASGLALAIGSFGGGMIAVGPTGWFSAGSGERYNFLPLALLGMAIVAVAQNRAAPSGRIATALCAIVVLAGATGYPNPLKTLAKGPEWRLQVARWHENHAYPLQAWPKVQFVDLSDVDRPCPKPSLETASMLDPGYCESTWLAGLKSELPKK